MSLTIPAGGEYLVGVFDIASRFTAIPIIVATLRILLRLQILFK